MYFRMIFSISNTSQKNSPAHTGYYLFRKLNTTRWAMIHHAMDGIRTQIKKLNKVLVVMFYARLVKTLRFAAGK